LVVLCLKLRIMLTRQVLYHLNHAANTFCFSYFWNKILLLCPNWSGLLSLVAGMTGMCHHALLFAGWDRVLQTFWCGLTLNHDPPILCLLKSWVYRFEPLCLSQIFLLIFLAMETVLAWSQTVLIVFLSNIFYENTIIV
jgi:hypothetical protein